MTICKELNRVKYSPPYKFHGRAKSKNDQNDRGQSGGDGRKWKAKVFRQIPFNYYTFSIKSSFTSIKLGTSTSNRFRFKWKFHIQFRVAQSQKPDIPAR